MLDPDNDQCVPKIPHCKAPMNLQPQGLALHTVEIEPEDPEDDPTFD